MTENEDEADDIMDNDAEDAVKSKHIRVTIQPDKIDGAEERDEVKGFDTETVVEIKFYQKDETTYRIQVQATKGDINHWKQYFTNED